MDRVISNKWLGKFSINSSVFDSMTSATIINDRYQLFATDRVFGEMFLHMRETD